MTNEEMFDAAAEVVKHHPVGQSGDGPREILNRLFRKNLRAFRGDKIADGAPILTPSNTQVTLERRRKMELRSLAPRERSDPPHRDDTPVVVATYLGKEALIDGGKRCHKWFTEGDNGYHEAYVVKVL
ncbi:MAG: hypothetical protein IT566_01490 [Rhodospirillaceae bacterium]|nr:hypothetical protein [Rhodospirillaceae bacterium]